MKKIFAGIILAIGLAVFFTSFSHADFGQHKKDIKLPEFGDFSSSTVSQGQEYVLGRTWLKAFRSQTREFADPITQNYVEQLIYRLSQHSQVQDKRFEIVMVDNLTMNAFAVPGGIVGVHNGLFLYAQDENQLASVLTHELAHLSQRHFARGIAEQKKNTITSMAGLLAGLVLAATTDGDAGLAALSASQALSLDQQLRYSRQNEQEADRIGIQNLYDAGMDPSAAPAMFEQMMRSTRFDSRHVPEFLRTHPLTEKRVADARNRLSRYPARQYNESLEYFLIKNRIRLKISDSPQKTARIFQTELKGDHNTQLAARYGLVLAYTKVGDFAQAHKQLALLREKDSNIIYDLAEVDLLLAEKKTELAEQLCRKILLLYPNHYPTRFALAESYIQAKNYMKADQELTRLSLKRPTDPLIWYELAEVRGQAGDIVGLHMARAEYFILNGALEQAHQQLQYAHKLAKHDFRRSEIISEKMRELAKLEEQIEKL